MKKIIFVLIIGLFISACSIFQVHKVDVEQGNIITPANLAKLRIGMSETQVKEVMGTPVLINVFSLNRLNYVYTFRKGREQMRETRVVLIFSQGRLKTIEK